MVMSTIYRLPDITNRNESHMIDDGQATTMGRQFGEQVASHPGKSGVFLLRHGRDAFAARALSSRGYTVHEAASGTEALEVMDETGGEIDLVMERAGLTVFVEVKTRGPGALDDPAAWVDRRKLGRMRRLAGDFARAAHAGDEKLIKERTKQHLLSREELIRYLESNNGDGIDINTIQAYRERYGIQD